MNLLAGQILEIFLSAEGDYLGANAVALELLGYTIEEFRALPPGALAGTRPDVARATWRSFVSGELNPDEPGCLDQFLAADGRCLTVCYLGTEPADDGTYVWRSSFLATGRSPQPGPWYKANLATERRLIQRDLAALSADAPERPGLEARAAAMARLQHGGSGSG